MAFENLPCLLVLSALLTISVDCSEADRWTSQSLPVVLDTHTVLLHSSSFSGREEDQEGGEAQEICGIECQRNLPPVDLAEQERILGYETMHENGTRTHTDVTLRGWNVSLPSVPVQGPTHTRRRREVFGPDGRFVISDWHFSTNYPFSSAVRLSTGCSGIRVSPKHVLTAAHCVHDGGDYMGGVESLKVGLLQLRTGRRRGGRRRGGRRRGGGQGDVEEGWERNSIDEDPGRAGRGGRSRRRRVRHGGEQGTGGGEEGRGGGGGDGEGKRRRRRRGHRVRRGTEPRKRPFFRWTRVKRIQIPQGWIHAKASPNATSPDYDYALLELKRPVSQKHMELGVAPANVPIGQIHFSGYDEDKSLLNGQGDEKVVYRFCSVEKESDHLMYQRCDAHRGAAGAGVYVRLRREAGDAGERGKWQRRVIGVFSGHRWVEVEGGGLREYNVAVRITPAKYAQICHWIHGEPGPCREV